MRVYNSWPVRKLHRGLVVLEAWLWRKRTAEHIKGR